VHRRFKLSLKLPGGVLDLLEGFQRLAGSLQAAAQTAQLGLQVFQLHLDLLPRFLQQAPPLGLDGVQALL